MCKISLPLGYLRSTLVCGNYDLVICVFSMFACFRFSSRCRFDEYSFVNRIKAFLFTPGRCVATSITRKLLVEQRAPQGEGIEGIDLGI